MLRKKPTPTKTKYKLIPIKDGSTRAARTELGIGEGGDDEVADKVSLSADSPKPRFARVVIG
jgi:hypothetical protein